MDKTFRQRSFQAIRSFRLWI